MSEEFKPINTQEEFDAAIGKRIERERQAAEGLRQQLADKDAEITNLGNQLAESQKSAEGFNAQIAELQAKVRTHETNSVKLGLANKYGLPAELADRISGETPEEMEADAEKLKAYIGKSKVIQVPVGESGEPLANDKTRAIKGMLSQMRGE